MRVTIVGCGDAFGSGGRLNTCYHLDLPGQKMLLDCGASAMIGMNRQGLDPNDVATIVISHLHGDHFAGLVFWLVHAQHVARRTAPLQVIGPPGIEQRVLAAAEALFAGSTAIARRYELTFTEITPEHAIAVGGATVSAVEVVHPSGAPSYGIRIEAGGKALAFSGDTEWTDALVPLAADADLMLIECYNWDRDTRYHMSWKTIAANLDRLSARRIVLTHMNTEALANRSRIDAPRVLIAEDGLVLDA